MKFIDDNGLIDALPNAHYSENALLFSVQNVFLTNNFGYMLHIAKCIQDCRLGEGIFMQHPSGLLTGDELYMSHDQLTAIFAFSYCYHYEFHTEIWKEIKRQWFRYNNVNVPTTFLEKLKNTSFIHPRDIIFYGYCCGGFIWKALLPILFILMLISTLNKYKYRPNKWVQLYLKIKGIPFVENKMIATDGKLLNFVRIKGCMSDSYIWKKMWSITTFLIKKSFSSWHNVFKIYFPYDDHPNTIASKNI